MATKRAVQTQTRWNQAHGLKSQLRYVRLIRHLGQSEAVSGGGGMIGPKSTLSGEQRLHGERFLAGLNRVQHGLIHSC